MQKRAGETPGKTLGTTMRLRCAFLVGGRFRPDQDVRFRSADIRVVEHRCHVPARVCNSKRGPSPLESTGGLTGRFISVVDVPRKSREAARRTVIGRPYRHTDTAVAGRIGRDVLVPVDRYVRHDVRRRVHPPHRALGPTSRLAAHVTMTGGRTKLARGDVQDLGHLCRLRSAGVSDGSDPPRLGRPLPSDGAEESGR